MGRLRIIQGGVRQRDARALLLTRGVRSEPTVRVHRVDTGAPVACRVARVPDAGGPSGAIRGALDRRGVGAHRIEVSGLEPGREYRIMAGCDGLGTGASFTTLPRRLPPDGLMVAVGTCYYGGYKRDRALYNSLSRKRWGQTPAFHIWAGDNLYVDVPADSHANRPIDHTVDRYLGYYLDSGYGRVRSMAPAFTTYDDHEYWNNYPEAVPWLSRSWDGNYRGYRDATQRCAELFQSSLNPGGASPCFSLSIPPLQFFFLDLRTFRTRSGGRKWEMTPPAALRKLEAWVAALDGPGVLVIGQPLWIAEGDWRDFNPPAYAAQYRRIWTALRHAPYDMLVVSGDVHHSRVAKISFGGSGNRHVYEFVSSPVCHIPTLAATVGLGNTQDQGSLDEIPGKVTNSGQSLSAQYFFGTDAPHSYGILRFAPLAHGQVRVGARFIDYYPRDQNAQAKRVKHLPRAPGASHRYCHDSKLITLRMR